MRTAAVPPRRGRSLGRFIATGVTAGLVLAMVPLAAVAAPLVDGGGAVSYTEQAPPVSIGEGVTITSDGSSYGGGYVDFQIGSAGATEFLSLDDDAAPVIDDGVVSIVDGSVYLGNGVTADIIGSIDPVLNGEAGAGLRVNFTSPFANPSFEAGEQDWTLMEQWINLGVTEIAGHVSQDTSNYDINTNSGPVTRKNDDRQPTRGYQSDPLQYIADVSSGDASDGANSLHLESSMQTVEECDIVHGPAAYSSPFEASAGDQIYFDWKASGSGDNTHVFGYIVDENGTQTEVLDATTPLGSTPWTEKATTIPANGVYRFVFVAGTFDYTCGTKAGASLLIDNVRVYGSKVKDDVVQDIVAKLRYENTSDAPELVRTVTVTAADNAGGSGSGQVTVNIAPVDDTPVLQPVDRITLTNTEATDDLASTRGSLIASDVDNDTITFSIEDGVADPVTVDGVEYTHSRTATYGTLRVNETTGDYLFVPDAESVEARLVPDSESFRVFATAAGVAVDQPVEIVVDVPAAAPAAPVNPATEAGPEQVALSWDAPGWIGGSPVTGYTIEKSTDGGETWEVVTADTGSTDTEYLVEGLINGVAVSFRISAINGNGTGPVSQTVTDVPFDVPGAPTNVAAVPGPQQAELSWDAPADNGGSAITGYRIEKSSDGGETWESVVEDTGSTGTSYTAEGLANGEKLTFRVAAINAAGAGPESASNDVTPRTVPDAATALGAEPGDRQVHLAWTAPEEDGGDAVTGYQIEQLGADGETWAIIVADTGSTGTEWTVEGLENGVKASFRVSPINGAGVGASSNTASATPRTVPGAPTDLVADAGNGTVALTWVPPVDDGGADVTGYLIEKSTDGGETWESVDETESADPAYTVEGLTNGDDVSFRVTAVNEAGPGAPSNTASATPRTVPDAATDLVTTPGDRQAELSWSAPEDDGGADVTGYRIEQSTDGGDTWVTIVPDTESADTTRTIDGLTNGEEVSFRVTPINEAGPGAVSDEASATPRTVPGAPTGLGAIPGDRQAQLSWSAPEDDGGAAITGYVIQQLDADGEWQTIDETGSPDTAYTVEGLTNGEEVSFRVLPVNAAGTGTPSNVAATTPRTIPGAPTDVVATPGAEQATVTWQAPVDDGGSAITGYLIEKSTDGGETWETVIADTASTETSYTVTGLANGDEVEFRVAAINAAGTGPASPTADVTPRTVPDAATELEAVPGDARVQLSWTAPADDGGADVTGYRVEQSNDGGVTWVTIVEDTGSAETERTIEGLTNGAEVSFRVSPINEAGAGEPSNTASATPRTVPDAPSITGIGSANRTLTVEFEAPAFDGGAEITAYEYSVDGGDTWVESTSSSSPIVIGGLVNGETYEVLVRAINEAGAGTASDPVEASPLLAPVPGADEPDAVPSVQPGESELLVDGIPQDVTVETRGGTWSVAGDGFTIELQGTDDDGAVLPIDEHGRLVVSEDGVVRVSGSGFAPGSMVDVWLLGARYLLGEVRVGEDGSFSAAFALPSDVELGPDTVQVNGVSEDGELRSLSTGIIVLPRAVVPALPSTGTDAGLLMLLTLLLLGAGAAATGLSRRRVVRQR